MGNKKKTTANSALMSVGQAAEFLGLSTETIYKMVHKKKIPFTRIGNLLKFRQPLLIEWLDKNTTKTK